MQWSSLDERVEETFRQLPVQQSELGERAPHEAELVLGPEVQRTSIDLVGRVPRAEGYKIPR